MSGEGGMLQTDQSKRPVSDLFRLLKSWIPLRYEPTDVSRDFWMPDHSCRVCYECDSKFTLFNRRHHCRLCGRIFCGKCTANSIPAPSNDVNRVKEEWQKVRVCNYCFKQWEQQCIASTNSDNAAAQLDSVYDPSGSPSGGSFNSSRTTDSSTITIDSMSFSLARKMSQNCSLSPDESAVMDHLCIDGKAEEDSGSSDTSGADMEDDKPSNQVGVNIERCELEDDGYSYKLDSNKWVNEYNNQDEVEGQPDPSGEKSGRKSFSSSILDKDHEPHNSFILQDVKNEIDNVGYEYEASSSSLCDVEDVGMEAVDFEDNGLLWLPPEPENEEDEKDAILLDDDDDEGEFGSGSFGCDDYCSRDSFAEDGDMKDMNKIVDGHFRALISQLLQVENIPVDEDDDRENWLEIITSLCWEAAIFLKPDMSRGGGMDPGGYAKVKCIASGRRSQSTVVKGVVCKKNVAHRRMATKIEKPCLMILGGALEYQRVSNLLASVDTLLKQEMDHLKMAVAKIDAHHPNVLLVEKSVSRFAQDYILEKNISLVLNIKRPLLERIARCTGAQIVPSVDHLSSQNLGYCDSFHVERLVEEHGSAGHVGKRLSKTLMYFEGCPRPLGCTILLRGANGDELKKVKAVIQYGVFAAYHLALETCFLADEGASLPELPLKDPITVALPNKSLTSDRSISMVSGFTIPANANLISNAAASGMSRLVEDVVVAPTTACPSRPSCLPGQLKDIQPTELASNENRFLGDSSISSTSKGNPDVNDNINKSVHGEAEVATASLQQVFEKNQGEAASSIEEFPPSPSDNQSILVSLSSWCVLKGTVCERSHLFRIKYYGSFDKPLGRVLQDHLFDQKYRCRSCEMPSDAHVQCYTHRQGSLTISVKKLHETYLPGERDGKIWMWHRCLRCPRAPGGIPIPPATRRVIMSDAAWGLSFGKFLELSFSNHAAASRVATCGHSLHRDCLRFYGSGKMVACFRYASIDVHSVFLPPFIVGFNYEIQDWIEKEADEVVDRAQLLFSIVLNALTQIVQNRSSTGGSINGGSKPPESRLHIEELKEVLQTEKTEFEEILQKTLKREVKKVEPAIDILEINRLRRQLLFQSYMWDHRLVYASILDQEERKSETEEKGVEEPPQEVDLLSPVTTASANNVLKLNSEDSDGQKICEARDKLESGIAVNRALLDIHFSFMNSSCDTLDAAWTGKDHPGVGSPLAADNSTSWLQMPFVNFYRALNTNFLGFNQKLDSVGVYNPIYVSSFQELEQQSGARLSLPVCTNETVIPVYDDEPTSIISYALVSQDYHTQLALPLGDLVMCNSLKSFGSLDDNLLSMSSASQSFHVPDSQSKSLHIRVSFSDNGPNNQVKYAVTSYYAKQFDGLRKICCPSELEFVRSLSRCKKWGAQGGKSNVFFAKTLDDRFIIKQVTKTELESFIRFAPEYFKYLIEAITTKSPTCLAKILGVYQVTTKKIKGGKETKMDVLVMENLVYGRKVTRMYDLKGSTRSRYNSDASGSNNVLLDENLIEAMPTSPIFLGNKAKRLLERAVWNDTSFLASVDVMDYSLLVGVDEEKHELVLGIIDFMRQYTWDKHLETWVKASGILGGSKNNSSPTVISPEQYKKRFRKAMTTYFLMVPDQWSPLPTT